MNYKYDQIYLEKNENNKITDLVILNKIIKESSDNLKNGYIISSLMTSLIIPDLCFNEIQERVIQNDLKENYKKGINGSFKYAYFFYKYAHQINLNKFNSILEPDSFLIGLFTYYLRCSFLHNGQLRITTDKSNQSSLNYFKSDLIDNLESKDRPLLNIDSRISKLKIQKSKKNKLPKIESQINVLFDVEPPDKKSLMSIKKSTESDYSITVDSTALIHLIIDSSNKFIQSQDINKPVEQEVHAPDPLILNGSKKSQSLNNGYTV